MNCLAFKPDNPNILVSCSDDETIKMWDIASGSILSTLSCESPVLSIALKDNIIAAGCAKGEIKLFKLNESQDWGEIQSEPPLRGHSRDNPECLCLHHYPYTANPECPVRGHRYVPSLSREYFLFCF